MSQKFYNTSWLLLLLLLLGSIQITIAQTLLQRNYSGLPDGVQQTLHSEASRLSDLVNAYFRTTGFQVLDVGLYDVSLNMQGEQSFDVAFQTADAEVQGQAIPAARQPILRSKLNLNAYLLMVWQVAADGHSLKLRWKLRLPDNGTLPPAELLELESILTDMGSQVVEQQIASLGLGKWAEAAGAGVKKIADLLERKMRGEEVLAGEVMLVKVSFRRQFDFVDISEQWLREEGKAPISYPICYARRDSIKMLPQITCPLDSATNGIRIRANWKGQTCIVAAVYDPVSKLIKVAPKPGVVLLNDDYIGVLDSFTVVWELSFDYGKKWRPVGVSKNRLYTVLKSPIGAQVSFLAERIVYFGCTTAQGVADSISLINKIWARFAGRKMSLQWFDPKLSNKTLTYYKNINPWFNTSNIVLGAQVNDSSFEPDGECQAYAVLFQEALLHQGISVNLVSVGPVESGHFSFLVKNWEFINARPNDSFPYWNQVKNEYIDQDSINNQHEIRTPNGVYNQWIGTVSFRDKEGVPAQGNANPYSDFERHFIVKIGETYFDPSYGKGYLNGLQSWEDQAIDGFRGRDVAFMGTNGKETHWVRVVKKVVGRTQMKPN